jgi:hypothetical protein
MTAPNLSAEIHWRAFELALAAADAQRVATTWAGPERIIALGLLAWIRIDQGQTREAVAVSDQAIALIDGGLVTDEDEHMVRLANVEALAVAGERERAVGRLAIAHRRLQDEADRIRNLALREQLLCKVQAHARIVELARRWGIDR